MPTKPETKILSSSRPLRCIRPPTNDYFRLTLPQVKTTPAEKPSETITQILMNFNIFDDKNRFHSISINFTHFPREIFTRILKL